MNLAIQLLHGQTAGDQSIAQIADKTTPIETPEGEKALAHDVTCDVDGDGTLQTIEIRPTGSSDAFRDLHQGLCDIGMSSRPITEAETKLPDAHLRKSGSPRTRSSCWGWMRWRSSFRRENKVDRMSIEQIAADIPRRNCELGERGRG